MDRSDSGHASTIRPPIRAHLVGIDDHEMAGLARWLTGRGVEVTHGRSVSGRIDGGHVPVSIPHSARWLVYAPGVPREHADRLAARRDGVPEVSYPEVLQGVLATGLSIAVSGRKQGAIAAAMIGWTLDQAGLDPTLLLRAGAPQLGEAGRVGRGAHVVVDVTGAIEAGRPGPEMAILLDLASLTTSDAKALAGLAGTVGGYLLAPPGHPALATETPARLVETLSLERGSHWWGADLRESRGCYRFRAFHKGRFAAEVRLRVPGLRSVLGALAAVAVCERVAVPTRAMIQALEEFAGISRGFQSRGGYRGVTLVDDDAVGPAEVADAIDLARAVHGRRRLWVVFAPVGPPMVETATALGAADRVLLLGAAVDAGAWASMLEGAGVAAWPVANKDEALEDLDRNLEPGDVLLTLGPGDVGTIADAFIRRLPRDRQGR